MATYDVAWKLLLFRSVEKLAIMAMTAMRASHKSNDSSISVVTVPVPSYKLAPAPYVSSTIVRRVRVRRKRVRRKRRKRRRRRRVMMVLKLLRNV